MKIEDILSEEEVKEYHNEWKLFDQKFVPETEHHVHSGKPVIGKVFRFKGNPIFKTIIVSKSKLRTIDPYFLFKKEYDIAPFWHIVHYFVVLEQMYHASMRLIRDTDRFITIDVPQEFELLQRVFWNETISIELIWHPRRHTEKYTIEDCFFALYNDESGEVKNRISARTFVEQRPYVNSIKKIKNGDTKEIEALIKMVESRAVWQRRLIKPRKKLLATKDSLITELKKGNVLEDELHDFFSFWDK